jgi:lipopolysaccharide/colanic/teichoic acid biosynthesis glycosyltransferase
LLKRIFDVLVSVVALALVIPVIALCAVIIKVDSKGPAFFSQQRVGRNARLFSIYKMRSMTESSVTSSPKITAAGDARITQVGQYLRRWKLDELPQLWNVLIGDMSLVGPRPEVPEYVALYPPGVRELILSVRPGITDEASIRFRNESELLAAAPDPDRLYVEKLLPAKLDLYQEYARRHSFLKDLDILGRTILSILRH